MIPKDLGFTTVGTVATSPLFKAFRVPGGNTLTYDCSFVICSVPCDGVSFYNTLTYDCSFVICSVPCDGVSFYNTLTYDCSFVICSVPCDGMSFSNQFMIKWSPYPNFRNLLTVSKSTCFFNRKYQSTTPHRNLCRQIVALDT